MKVIDSGAIPQIADRYIEPEQQFSFSTTAQFTTSETITIMVALEHLIDSTDDFESVKLLREMREKDF